LKKKGQTVPQKEKKKIIRTKNYRSRSSCDLAALLEEEEASKTREGKKTTRSFRAEIVAALKAQGLVLEEEEVESVTVCCCWCAYSTSQQVAG
jgi:hypothetical protein